MRKDALYTENISDWKPLTKEELDTMSYVELDCFVTDFVYSFFVSTAYKEDKLDRSFIDYHNELTAYIYHRFPEMSEVHYAKWVEDARKPNPSEDTIFLVNKGLDALKGVRQAAVIRNLSNPRFIKVELVLTETVPL